jgi:threonine/homoserine/homoserine lactone efflux protein
MSETITFLITGTVFGLTAGISPGPLLTLVITETIKHNKAEGIKVAIAPLLTDIPIIVITLLVLSKLANFDPILGTIAILGGIFVAYLGYESIKTKGLEIDIQNVKPQSIKRGIIVNALSPHPYLFWLTVGAPITFKAYQSSLSAALAFIIAFYVLLVGSKVGVAMLVDKSRNFLKNKTYIWTMRILGLALLVFAALFIKDGLKFFELL